MPLIFLEYKPLCSEREFSNFWQFVSAGQMNDGLVNEARLFKIREGLFIGMISFEPENRAEVMQIYGDSNTEGSNLNSICKTIRLKHTAKELL